MSKSQFKMRLVGLFIRLVQYPRVVLFHLMSNNESSGRPIRCQPLQLVGLGSIKFDSNVCIGVFPSPLFFSTYAYIEARNSCSAVHIGKNTWINNNFRAIAEHTIIEIGSACRIGSNVEILDSDFHGLKIEDRNVSRPESAKPVFIGNDVFVGNNVTILKGVSIGNGSVIANGSLVISDIPANSVAGGTPAKVIRIIE
jgi:acetyltransferase-like isoleucine patch superfamily enzyme